MPTPASKAARCGSTGCTSRRTPSPASAPTRRRKLLMHRAEIDRLLGKLNEAGTTLVPLKVYFKNGMAKVELALAQGKRQWDKRQALAERDAKREAERH